MPTPSNRNGDRIKAARLARGWTQAKLGDAIFRAGYGDHPLSQKTVWSLEKGRPVPARMRGPLQRALKAAEGIPGLALDDDDGQSLAIAS